MRRIYIFYGICIGFLVIWAVNTCFFRDYFIRPVPWAYQLVDSALVILSFYVRRRMKEMQDQKDVPLFQWVRWGMLAVLVMEGVYNRLHF